MYGSQLKTERQSGGEGLAVDAGDQSGSTVISAWQQLDVTCGAIRRTAEHCAPPRTFSQVANCPGARPLVSYGPFLSVPALEKLRKQRRERMRVARACLSPQAQMRKCMFFATLVTTPPYRLGPTLSFVASPRVCLAFPYMEGPTLYLCFVS